MPVPGSTGGSPDFSGTPGRLPDALGISGSSDEIVIPDVLKQAADAFVTEMTKARKGDKPRIDAVPILAFPLAVEELLLQSLQGQEFSYGAATVSGQAMLVAFENKEAVVTKYASERKVDPNQAWNNVPKDRGAPDLFPVKRTLGQIERNARPDYIDGFRFRSLVVDQPGLPFRIIVRGQLSERSKQGGSRGLHLRLKVIWHGDHDGTPPPEAFLKAVAAIRELFQEEEGVLCGDFAFEDKTKSSA